MYAWCIRVVGYDSVWARIQTDCKDAESGVWVLLYYISSQLKYLAEEARGRAKGKLGDGGSVLRGAVVMAMQH